MDPPQSVTYSSVASRDSVQILLTIYAFHCLYVNFFTFRFHASILRQIKKFFQTVLDFGPNLVLQVLVIVRTLYGM